MDIAVDIDEGWIMDYDAWFDYIELAAGVYVLFTAMYMKLTGVVKKNMLMSRSLDVDRAPDPQGYIRAVFLPSVAAGLVLIAGGLATRYFAGTAEYKNITVAVMFAAAAVVVVYGFVIVKAQKKFLE